MAGFVASNQHNGFVNGISALQIADLVSKTPVAEQGKFQFLDVRNKDEWAKDGVPNIPSAKWIHMPGL